MIIITSGGGGGGKRKKYISPRGSIPFHYMSGRGLGRNILVCRGIIICHRGVVWGKVIMSQGGDGIHHLSRGMTVAENLSMGVNQGNYYVLGGYGKFFLHRGVFLFTGIAHCITTYIYIHLSPVGVCEALRS